MDQEDRLNTVQPELQPVLPVKGPEPADSAQIEPATTQHLSSVERQMSAFEKSTLRWAKTAVFMSFLAAVFVCLQWWEMHTGGVDTHNLATAAGNQANWTQQLSDNMKTQGDRTKDLADRMKDQADRTKTIAEEARIQAGAAKSAADTARDALQISERAYLAAGIPFLEAGFVNIPILNTGHIPSGKGILIIHEATLIVDPRHLGILTKPAEQHRRSHTVENVPPNLPMSVDVPLPIFSAEEFNGGRQQIVIAGTLTYNDGFAATKDQLWKFCDIGQFSDLSRKVEWMPCDPEDALTRLTYGDHYPQGEYQGTQPTSNPN